MKLCLFCAIFLFSACSSLQSLKKNPTDEELFRHGEKLKKNAYYKEALTYFKQLKSRFLYSSLVKEADLSIADIYFAQKAWSKAQGAYAQFFELYPQHPQRDRALLNLALSYFHQLPKTEDRDLSLSKKALFHLDQHLKTFPNSHYRKSAKEHKRTILTLLARREWMLVRFHLRQKRPQSALPYLRNLKKKYGFLLPLLEKPPQPKKSHLNPRPTVKPKKPHLAVSHIRNFKGQYKFFLPSERKLPDRKKKKPRPPYLPSLQKLKKLEKQYKLVI